MDNKLIKKYLDNINEAVTPGLSVTSDVLKKNKTINSDGVKTIEKDTKNFNKTKSDNNTKKYNTTDKEKIYHDEMEILNGQEMIEYDRDPNQDFKDRAKEGIEGSSRMGNKGGIGNAEPIWGASNSDFGKNKIKDIKNSTKKRMDAEKGIMSFGDDIEIIPKGNKPMGKHSAINEGFKLGKGYTHFAIFKSDNKIADGWDYKSLYDKSSKSYDNESIKEYSKEDLKDKYPNNKLSDFKIVTRKFLEKSNIDISDSKNWYNIGDNKQEIKESMKRLKFKNSFNGVSNAIKLIPETYKIDKKTFEMTDGNEAYKIRWEGSLNEGKAVILMASDKNLVNEDMQKMKHLMSYDSTSTLGVMKGKERLTENTVFTDMVTKLRKLTESEDIDDQETTETSMEKIDDVKEHADEAKEHVEGSVSEDDGTQTAKPKEGTWDKIKVPQAPEAKKDINEGITLNGVKYELLNENFDDNDFDDDDVQSDSYDDEDYGDSEINDDGFSDNEEIPDIEPESPKQTPNINRPKLMKSLKTDKYFIVGGPEKTPIPVPDEDKEMAKQDPEAYIEYYLDNKYN